MTHPSLVSEERASEERQAMKSKPFVSIVTPCYNGMPFIESCMTSVLEQDYPHVEHVVQDGASTDGSQELIARYARKNSQIKWISEPDEGQSDGLNRALQRSKGDVILVLNADDELLPHACSWGVEQMEKYSSAAVVYGGHYCINARGSVIGRYRGTRPYHFKKMFCVEKVIPTQAAFIRRSCFEQVGFYADVTRKTCPDFEMWVRIGLRFPIKHAKGFVCRYRRHPGSEGSQNSMVVKMIESKQEVIERVLRDPNTSVELKTLGKRAHSGAIFWGAIVLLGNGAPGKSFHYLAKSFLIYPPHIIKWILTSPYRVPLFFAKQMRQSLSLTRDGVESLLEKLKESFAKRAF